ncbi:MAG: hypothetical protein LIP08_15360 [Bacteroides sp.]|nr:hypothetical protein [Bacteroides sp.]
MAQLKTVDLQLEVNGVYQSADIDKSTSFAFNFQREDLKNPTSTQIPFSVSIGLPNTEKNNDLFSHMGQYDAKILNINPLMRTHFILYVNDRVYQRGYMTVENVTLTNYHIRLYGGLGDYFNLLKEVSDDRDMRLKSLDFGDMFDHTIDRSTLKTYWQTEGKKASYHDYSTGRDIHEEVLNYAMTYQGVYDSFDSGFYVNGILESDTGDVIWESGNKKYSTSRELSEHERSFKLSGTQYHGEYRSYYQKPVIKVKPIVCRIIEKMESDGWKTELDKTFFNTYNPYWNNLWMVCPNYEISNDQVGETLELTKESPSFTNPSAVEQSSGIAFREITVSQGYLFENKTYTLTFDIPFWLLTHQEEGDNDRIGKGNPLIITADIYIGGVKQDSQELVYDNKPSDENKIFINSQTVTMKNVTKFRNETKQGQTNNPFYCLRDKEEQKESGYYDTSYRTLYRFRGGISYNGKGSSEKIVIRFTFDGDTHWYKNNGSSIRKRSIQIIFLDPANVKGADQTITCNISSTAGSGTRTGAKITYKSILRSEDTCFDFLMSYLKPFGMYFVKDPIEKKVTILTRNSYFGNRECLNWTYKIDYSREHKIRPVPFDYKIGIFKWQDTGTKYEGEYVAKYAKEYGSARFNTGGQFIDTEHNYLDTNIFGNGIVVNGYSSYFLGRDKTLYKDNKELLYFQDPSGTGVDIPYILCFKEGYKKTTDNFLITDDNDAMLEYGYAYTTANREAVSSYPAISRLVVAGNEPYSLNFGRPAVVYNDSEDKYFDETDTTAGAETLYTRFWREYLYDRFSQENKMLECHVTLTQNDVKDDLFNKFIFIQDTVWVLNKITGFDPLSNTPTKCEFISVQNIDSYISQQYISGNFIIHYGENKIYDYVDEPNPNPIVLRFNSDARNLQFQFVAELDWQVTHSSLAVTPANGTGGGIGTPHTQNVTIQVSENKSGELQAHFIPIKWGNTTTFIQIIQEVYCTVTATSNYGIVTINGAASPQVITLNETATFAVSYDTINYDFLYWNINGAQYFTETVSLNVSVDLHAEAVLSFNPTIHIEPFTQIINKTSMAYQINVTSNTTWELLIPSQAAGFVSADRTSGDGDSVVTITVEPNPNPEARTAELTFVTTFGTGDISTVHTLTQEGAPEIGIVPDTIHVDAEGNENK